MAFKETITFDRTEMIVYAKLGKRPAILNLTYERIISIRLDHGTMPFLRILKKPSDRIAIQLRRFEKPVILYSAVLAGSLTVWQRACGGSARRIVSRCTIIWPIRRINKQGKTADQRRILVNRPALLIL